MDIAIQTHRKERQIKIIFKDKKKGEFFVGQSSCLLGRPPNEHAPFEWSELFIRQQIVHPVFGIDGEAHMMLIVVDPQLLPLAIVEPSVRPYNQLSGSACVQREVEHQLVI